jgi:hypothetical protein
MVTSMEEGSQNIAYLIKNDGRWYMLGNGQVPLSREITSMVMNDIVTVGTVTERSHYL